MTIGSRCNEKGCNNQDFSELSLLMALLGSDHPVGFADTRLDPVVDNHSIIGYSIVSTPVKITPEEQSVFPSDVAEIRKIKFEVLLTQQLYQPRDTIQKNPRVVESEAVFFVALNLDGLPVYSQVTTKLLLPNRLLKEIKEMAVDFAELVTPVSFPKELQVFREAALTPTNEVFPVLYSMARY